MENHIIKIAGRLYEANIVPSKNHPQMVGKLAMLSSVDTGKPVWKLSSEK